MAYERTEFNSHWWWSLLGAGAVYGAGAALGNYGYDQESSNYTTAGAVLGAVGAVGAITSLIACIVGETYDGDQEVLREQEPVVLSARLEGFRSAERRLDPSALPASVLIGLQSIGSKGTSDIAESPKPAPDAELEVIAVHEVHDLSDRISATERAQLTSYLGALLTQTGRYQPVPRSQLRAQLREDKSSSYRSCYDESCQIEVGKAVAAEKSLSTNLIRVGRTCALTASLFDIRTETAERAASVETTCDLDDLLPALRDLVAQL